VAALVTEQGIVHYEVYGRGRPVLLLHGWMNSWAVWRKTVEMLGRDYRVYALDFLGFGEFGEKTAELAEDFSVSNFTVLVNQFMDRMGIVKAPLIGHSMGGTVSLRELRCVPRDCGTLEYRGCAAGRGRGGHRRAQDF